MRKQFLQVLVLLMIVFSLFIVGLSSRTNLYENMVDASVRLPGNGSGVFIENDVILTAAHCLEGRKSIIIELNNGVKLKSKDFYIDKKEDVAFVFVNADEPYIAKISSMHINIGDSVYLVGAVHNKIFKFSLTKGIVSHLDRDLSNMGWKDLLQTDAEGGSGSSGGPLYNSNGGLIGIYVGHAGAGGMGVSLCESAKSILEAYQRCKNARN